MKIKIEKAIVIENLGVFVFESNWNGFSKFINYDTKEYIISFARQQSLFESIISDDNEVRIIAVSDGIKDKIKDIKC